MLALRAAGIANLAPLSAQTGKSTARRSVTRCTLSHPGELESDVSSLVPRRCTLKELSFSEDGRLITKAAQPSSLSGKSAHLAELFLATVEASAQVKDLETLSGRLSMVAFFVAICMELATGSGIFSTVDQEGLQRALGVSLVAVTGAGAFAVAWRGKRNVTDILSTGCQRLFDSTVDSLVDALFFDEAIVPHSVADSAKKTEL